MAKKLMISSKCVGCGICFSSKYIKETPDGMAEINGLGVFDEEEEENIQLLISRCPENAIQIEDSENMLDKSALRQQLSDLVGKLKDYRAPLPTEQNFPFKKEEYHIPIPVASGENRYEYSSESAAENAAKSEFNIKMYSQIDFLILQVITEYRAKYLLPYYSKNAEDKSFYLKCNNEVSAILKNIEEILNLLGIGDDIPIGYSSVEVFPENDLGWKMLNKGQLMSDEMVSTVKNEFRKSNYSDISSYYSYWEIDDMEVSAGTDWRGNTKYKDKYCYRNVRDAFIELAKDLLDACYYVDNSIMSRAVEIIKPIVNAYNEMLQKEIKNKVAYAEKKLYSLPDITDERQVSLEYYEDVPEMIWSTKDGLKINGEIISDQTAFVTESAEKQFFFDGRNILVRYISDGLIKNDVVYYGTKLHYVIGYKGHILFEEEDNALYYFDGEKSVSTKVVSEVYSKKLYKDVFIYSTADNLNSSNFNRYAAGNIGFVEIVGGKQHNLFRTSYGDGVIFIEEINDNEIHYSCPIGNKKGIVSWNYQSGKSIHDQETSGTLRKIGMGFFSR